MPWNQSLALFRHEINFIVGFVRCSRHIHPWTLDSEMLHGGILRDCTCLFRHGTVMEMLCHLTKCKVSKGFFFFFFFPNRFSFPALNLKPKLEMPLNICRVEWCASSKKVYYTQEITFHLLTLNIPTPLKLLTIETLKRLRRAVKTVFLFHGFTYKMSRSAISRGFKYLGTGAGVRQ